MLLDSLFTGTGFDAGGYVLCLGASAVCGVLLALIHSYRNRATNHFRMSLILLPMLVQTVIVVVNGNIGTGVAVAGAFSLIRFRSMQGNSREITSVFAAMAVGLADGMGYVSLGFLTVAAVGVLTVLLENFFAAHEGAKPKESLDYYGVFDDIFRIYTKKAELVRVKTTNMGSLYELEYHILETDESKEKEMIDSLRVRNGNLNIVCGQMKGTEDQL